MGHAWRAVALGVLVWIGGGTAGADADATASTGVGATCIPASQCCKICDKGQACGNTCISRAKQCHKGRGCACDLDEVCGAAP